MSELYNKKTHLWESAKNWLVPVTSGVPFRSTKFVVSCSQCQCESFITYAQAWSILKENNKRACNKCHVRKRYNSIIPKKRFVKKTKEEKQVFKKYKELFGRKTDPQIIAQRKEKYRKASQAANAERMKTDKIFYAMKLARNRTNSFLRARGKIKISKSLGCSYAVFKEWIEQQFQPGMCWDNYGEWHLDHKFPLSVAYKLGKEKFKEACHYTNIQPLWAVDNIKKGNKIYGST